MAIDVKLKTISYDRTVFATKAIENKNLSLPKPRNIIEDSEISLSAKNEYYDFLKRKGKNK